VTALTTAASVTCGSTKDQLVSCFSATRDSHGSSPSSHWIGDLSCGIIINHLTVHMCSIQHGLTSAIPLPRLLVMIAFDSFVLPSPSSRGSLHHASAQLCRQHYSTQVLLSLDNALSLDKEVLQWTIRTYRGSLSWETCLVLPLSGNPNNPALSSKTRHGIYIPTTNTPPIHSLSSNNNSHPISPSVQLTPKPLSQKKKKALVANHTDQKCATSRTPSPAATRPPWP
jgi:hypothetical protein